MTDFTETSMVWTAKDDRSDVQVFVRCDGIPDENRGKQKNKGRKFARKAPEGMSGPGVLFRRPGRPERRREPRSRRVGNARNLHYLRKTISTRQ